MSQEGCKGHFSMPSVYSVLLTVKVEGRIFDSASGLRDQGDEKCCLEKYTLGRKEVTMT